MNKIKLNKQFILASGSKRRLELLNQISIKPDLVLTPDINETNYSQELPLNYVKRMSVEKNKVFQTKYSQSIILTADTVVSLGRRILPKTINLKMAKECLQLISGRRHKVLTSFALYSPDFPLKVKTIKSTVKFKRLHPDELDYYLKSNEWKGKAGAYGIQGSAEKFIQFISGSYTNIVGLPLNQVYGSLNSVGYYNEK